MEKEHDLVELQTVLIQAVSGKLCQDKFFASIYG